MSEHDLELRERFEALRTSDAEAAPTFASMRHRRPAPRRIAWVPAVVLTAASIATIALLARAPGARSVSMDEAMADAKEIASWTAPTDPLLIVSDLSIPDTVPSLTPASVALPRASASASDSGDSR
jgi:hypothetical protein